MNILMRYRKNLHLTQQELANKLGIKRTTYCSYENGKSMPSAENLIKLADFFNISTDSLLGREPEIVDLRAISANQRLAVEAIVNKLTDEQVARVVGYIDNLK